MELLMLAASARLFSRTDRAIAVAKYFVIIPGVLVAISLLSVSVSDWLVDLSVPAAVVLAYFSFATIFDTNSRAFVSGTGAFGPTPGEVKSGQLQVACLPASLPRRQVEAMLLRPGCPIKLWMPLKAGLGTHWNGQGWVVWRWFVPGSDDIAGRTPDPGGASEFELRWHDVPGLDAQSASFSLVHTIAAAAKDAVAPLASA
jgi:hypothetical protein